MRKREGETSVSSMLTVYFDGQFWVGVAERRSAGALEVCRTVFGAEPSNEEIYRLVLGRWASLPFSAGVGDGAAPRRAGNPKRRQREAARARPSTRAQKALALAREASRDEAADRRAERRHAERRERYERGREKRKRRRKGR